MTRFYDLVEPGMTLELGTHTFEAEAIKAFARRYDPQRFHLDEEEAEASVLGGLCASGWHTAAVWMRLNIANGRAELRRVTGWTGPDPIFGPSPGVKHLKWVRPVFSGETVHYTSVTTGKRRLASRPGWGLLFNESHGRLPDGTPVLSMEGAVLIALGDAAGG